jgi:nicotinamide mononucleotide (NMN) deamidase PncC
MKDLINIRSPQLDEPLEVQVGTWLRQKNLKLAIAESCTGGLIGHRLTNIPGSSDYYLGSITAYEMASGIRHTMAQDFPLDHTIGMAVSGIAGPGGGMPGKPVGLVWIGLSVPEGDFAWHFIWPGNRIQNKEDTAQKTLEILKEYLHGHVPPQN